MIAISVKCIFLQAYTVELEAELNQLKEENALLKQALVSTVSLPIHIFQANLLLLTRVLHSILYSKQAEAEFERKIKQQVDVISSFSVQNQPHSF